MHVPEINQPRRESFLGSFTIAGVAKQLLAGLLLLKIAVLFLIAWNRRIVMDEFAQLGYVKYLGNGFYGTIWPSKTVGFQLFIDLAHVIGWNATSILLIGRMETALLACGTLAIVYACGRRLGEPNWRALLILLVLLSFSNFIERIFATRAEPLATFFAAAALLVGLRGRDRRHLLGAGALSGLAFLTTQKAIYFDVALGLALAGDAALARRFSEGIGRGAWLVAGWVIPVAVYCFAFGGAHPLAVAENLFFGPLGVASPQIAAEYGGLRHFVVQTLVRNALLYAFCFAGIVLALVRIARLEPERRIALIFTVAMTLFVFTHNQPWPYVFVMALPFVALWSLDLPMRMRRVRVMGAAAWGLLAVAIGASFVGNALYLRLDNHDQLALVGRAESLLGPDDVYFDGVGMLPNRAEPSTLWLDRHTILQTQREGNASEAWHIFANTPPKVIIWSYRMDAIEPIVGPLVDHSYARVAPNIRLAGVRVRLGKAAAFRVPIPGDYALYDASGRPAAGVVEVNDEVMRPPLKLSRRAETVRLVSGPPEAFLVLQDNYSGKFAPGRDNPALFAGVYR